MNTTINDGGPAFPLSPEVGRAHFDDPFAYHGMSLRDWFAGQALAGNLASDTAQQHGTDRQARWAYDQADAMLAAREGKG